MWDFTPQFFRLLTIVFSFSFYVFSRLPVPWLLFGLVYGKPVEVNSKGMVCSIAILFFMLMFVILSIACFHWRMNKGLGFTMFLLYFVFVTVSLLFEYKVITCPVWKNQKLLKTLKIYKPEIYIYILFKVTKTKNESYKKKIEMFKHIWLKNDRIQFFFYN